MKQLDRLILLCLAFTLVACSTTKNIPDDDQLFVGLSKIEYENPEGGAKYNASERKNLETAKEEVEAALATAPNGALFGSSFYRTPFPYGLWIWNAFSSKEDKFSRWMTESFGKQPVLMSWVNPELRASVAQSLLRNYGYFHNKVDYDIIPQHNPKKSKIGYQIKLGPLLTIDTVSYVGFAAEADSLIQATQDKSLLREGDPFTVASLDAERNRISNLFRNNGYYFYQPSYASYLADTMAVPGKAQLRFQLANDIPDEAQRKWYMGHITVNLRKTFMQPLTDSIRRRSFTINFSGKKSPLRTRVIMGSMKLRHRQPYSYDKYLETVSAINATGLFSMVDFQFTPRPALDDGRRMKSLSPDPSPVGRGAENAGVTSEASPTGGGREGASLRDSLDLEVSCVFERPYDFYIESNFIKRTIGRLGPELKLGITRRNAFRGGEKFDVNVHGSYEWQTHSTANDMNSYEYGADASIEFPRIVAPFFGGNRTSRRTITNADGTTRRVPRRLFYAPPTTLAKVSSDIVRRPGYYKMHIVAGEWTYRWQPSANSRHEFSPLTVKYQFMNSHTEKFDEIITQNPYLTATMSDYFIPQMRYTYIYGSPSNLRNPIQLTVTLSESGNVSSLGYMAFGRKWNERDKKMFKNPYSQFLKMETDFTKTWSLSTHSSLVGHLGAGVVYSYANSEATPFSELFYVGGANSVRAFPIRGIGPGDFPGLDNPQASYLFQNGDVKFLANLEYRQRLFGNLHGALFLDAGNVWNIDQLKLDDTELDNLLANTRFKLKSIFNQVAVGTGVGLRYDLDFLILRLDWGIGLHVPYKTEKSGFFNLDSFRRYQTLHFAIGYPF